MTMQIFARRALAMAPPAPALLLEGSWSREQSGAGRWSLDDSVDARFAWIDRWASEQAARLADGQSAIFAASDDAAGVAYMNELALRYFLVKLARVVAFFDEVRSSTRGETWQLHLARDQDAVYAELFAALAERHRVRLVLHWHEVAGPVVRSSMFGVSGAKDSCPAERKSALLSWRGRAARIADIFTPRLPNNPRAPRVILCGNPRILDPVCAELLARNCRVGWLYERFAVRAWWKWRRDGIGQLVCDGGATSVGNALRGVPQSAVDAAPPLSEHQQSAGVGWAERSESHHLAARPDEVQCGQRWDSLRSAHPTPVSGACHVTCRGVTLGGAINDWLAEQRKNSDRQARWLQRINEHFRAVQPTALVLDEDATPFKRAAVAMARTYDARTLVVQHGAPCGPFGFAPLAADEICVWGQSTREQLTQWDIADSRIHVTGWPSHSLCRERPPWRSANAEPESRRPPTERHGGRSLPMPIAPRRPPRFLLLATVPPDDRRPDTMTFHLTSHTHAQMIDMAFAAVSRFAGARLTIKLHPRTRDQRVFQTIARRWRQLDVRLVSSGDSAALTSRAHCILSCASTAGIEAALAGAPVVQLLPHGSGEVLPADRWGLVGSARTLEELSPLIDRALVRGWCAAPKHLQRIVAQTGPQAANAIVDRILNPSHSVASDAWECPDFELPGHPQSSAPATLAGQVAIE